MANIEAVPELPGLGSQTSDGAIGARLDNLEAAVGEAGHKIQVLSDGLTNIVGHHSDTLNSHATRLDALRQKIDGDLEQIAELRCDVVGVANRLAEVEGFVRGVAELDRNVAALTESGRQLIGRQTELVHGIALLVKQQRAAHAVMWFACVGAGLLGGALAMVIGMLGVRL